MLDSSELCFVSPGLSVLLFALIRNCLAWDIISTWLGAKSGSDSAKPPCPSYPTYWGNSLCPPRPPLRLFSSKRRKDGKQVREEVVETGQVLLHESLYSQITWSG